MAYEDIFLRRAEGEVHCHLYDAPGAAAGVILVGGVGGGFDSPARELYPRLCDELADEGVVALRVRFRHSTNLDESVKDVIAGASYLAERGVRHVGLVGHSFGGAVVVRAADRLESARAVVALATQSHGADGVGALGPRCAVLLIHGLEDEVLPPRCSTHVHERAAEPKRLLLFPGAGHSLDEVHVQVHDAVREWLLGFLAR